MNKFSDQKTMLTYRDGQNESLVYHKLKLLVLEGSDQGCEQVVDVDVIKVGSAPDNNLCLTDSTVSRYHFEIRVTESGYLIRDLNSTNGTKVDGCHIIEAYLRPGARIKAGDVVLVFEPLHEVVKVPLSPSNSFGKMLGRSVKMRALFHMVQRVSTRDVTVLITGPTGVGKGLLATEIHNHSYRSDKPLVVVDCSTIPSHLMESELFGHAKGAFTGAVSTTIGLFEQAHGGTILLDEIGELPPMLQPKLLRVLETLEVKKVGDTKLTQVDVRIIACTNQDLRAKVETGQFRQDLFFRLGVFELNLPSLKERKEDIPILAQSFLKELCPNADRNFNESAIQYLVGHQWPGNVRELHNLIERAVHLVDEKIIDTSSLIGTSINEINYAMENRQKMTSVSSHSFYQARDMAERGYLLDLLKKHGYNVSKAALTAGIHRQSLHRLLKKHRIRSSVGEENESN